MLQARACPSGVFQPRQLPACKDNSELLPMPTSVRAHFSLPLSARVTETTVTVFRCSLSHPARKRTFSRSPCPRRLSWMQKSRRRTTSYLEKCPAGPTVSGVRLPHSQPVATREISTRHRSLRTSPRQARSRPNIHLPAELWPAPASSWLAIRPAPVV